MSFLRRIYRGHMKSRLVTLITCMILFSWLAVAVRLGAQDEAQNHQRTGYRVFDLGTLGGSSSSGNTLNDIGWAMGSANLPGNTTEHATVWIYGLKFDLGTLGGPNSAVEWPVKNDHGKVAGISETPAKDPLGEAWSCSAFFPTVTGHICRGFVWQWGAMTPLPTLGGNNGYAAGANNRGQVVGWAENTVHDPTCVAPQVLQFEAVVYGPEPGQIRQLPPFQGDPDGAATAINDKGQVVGISGTCDVAVGAFSAKHALLWENGVAMNLGSLGGKGWNTPTAINHQGQVVGFSDLPGDVSGGTPNANFHAFLWTKEAGMRDLGTLPGDTISEALDINDRGQIVGVSYPSSRAFLWEDGVMKDLNTLVASDSPLYLIAAGGINERGEITGQGCVLSNGACTSETPAFLALPNCDREEREGSSAPAVDVPETVRQQVWRGLAFGRLGPVR